jgi:hypothetical protein
MLPELVANDAAIADRHVTSSCGGGLGGALILDIEAGETKT